jgi:hypothetical protein
MDIRAKHTLGVVTSRKVRTEMPSVVFIVRCPPVEKVPAA